MGTSNSRETTADSTLPGEWLFRFVAAWLTFAWLAAVSGPVMLAFVFLSVSFDSPAVAFVGVPGFIITPFVAWAVVVVHPLYRTGQTVGMRLLGLRMESFLGDDLEMGRIVAREALQAVTLPLVVGMLGAAWAIVDAQGRTVFDRIAGTRVVQSPARWRLIDDFRRRGDSGEGLTRA